MTTGAWPQVIRPDATAVVCHLEVATFQDGRGAFIAFPNLWVTPQLGTLAGVTSKGSCQREESGDSLGTVFVSQDGEQDAVCGGTIFEDTHGSEFRYTIQCYKLHLMMGEQVRRKASSR